MRANREFDLSSVARWDSIKSPFQDNPTRDFGQPGSCKTLEYIRHTNQTVPNNTFDDLWDWRLKHGNLLVGEDMKKYVQVYHPTSAVKPLPSKSGTRSRIESKQSRELQAPASDDESENSQADKDGTDHCFKELAEMANMSSEEITRKFAKKKKRLVARVLETTTDGPQNLQVATPKLGVSIDFGHRLAQEDSREADFEISDEELKQQFQEEMKEKMSDFKGYNVAKNMFKAFVRRKRNKNEISQPEYFNDVKKDEDFRQVGDAIVGEDVRAEPLQPIREEPEEKEAGKDIRYLDNGDSDPRFEVLKDISKGIGILIAKKKIKGVKEKKKKKKNAAGKEILLTPEEVLENKIVEYYQKRSYENLKLEAWFPLNIIPPPAFTSIHEVLPHFVADQKSKTLHEKVNKQEKTVFAMEYAFGKLSKAKKNPKPAKKNQKVRSASESRDLNNSSSVGSGGKNQSSSEFDSEEEAGRESDEADPGKGSEAKQRRHQFFETNELYLKHKPFPLKASKNKAVMLSGLLGIDEEAAAAAKTSSNKIVPLSSASTLGSRKEKNRMNDFQADESVVTDRFNKDLSEVSKQLAEHRETHHHFDYEMLYMTIKANDSKHEKIENFNWSGNQVMGLASFSLSQTDKTIDSLNNPKFEIWLTGFAGFIKTTKRYCRDLVDSRAVGLLLTTSVFLNTLILATDGLLPEAVTPVTDTMNLTFTYIFTAECSLKIYGLGISRYRKDVFNVFDFFIVCLSLVEVVINSASSAGGGGAVSAFKAVRIFRIFRVLRVTRLLRSLRFMQVIIQVIRGTMEQFAYIALLMFLFIFIFTLLGTQIFGGQFSYVRPYARVRYNFDSFESAFYTVFIILTMENWNDILVSCLRSDVSPAISLIYLIAWIFIGNYIFLNLFLAILLEGFESSDAMQMIIETEQESRELERVHKQLIVEMEAKKKSEALERQDAEKRVLLVVEPERYAEEEQIKNSSACYLVVRNNDEDNPSLSDHLDVKAHLKRGLTTTKAKVDPFKDVTCNKAMFYFSKSSRFRLFCAKVVSHSKYLLLTQVRDAHPGAHRPQLHQTRHRHILRRRRPAAHQPGHEQRLRIRGLPLQWPLPLRVSPQDREERLLRRLHELPPRLLVRPRLHHRGLFRDRLRSLGREPEDPEGRLGLSRCCACCGRCGRCGSSRRTRTCASWSTH